MTTSQAPTPELLALHRRYGQSRCTKLRNRLVEAHLNLVRQQAARFAQASSACFDELFQEGCFGLLMPFSATNRNAAMPSAPMRSR